MKYFCSILMCLASMTLSADDTVRARILAHEAKMSYLDNGVIKLGVDLNAGGSITYLSRSAIEQNLVNDWDFGREIQMSYYAGPVPFEVPGKQLDPHWTQIGWNPIQVGDAFGNPARLLETKNDGKSLYVKCIPMHWPLERMPGECIFEAWFVLNGPVVRARCKLTNQRPDHTQYAARMQELPAIYTNGPWYRLMSYTGPEPFTNAPLSRIEKPREQKFPWAQFQATENWVALVDDHDFGLGIVEPGIVKFTGGFAGKPGAGGSKESPTGYMAPQALEVIDWNIEHEYHYDLVVGTLAEIRQHALSVAANHSPTQWSFDKDRQGWSFVHATDSGWPIRGELNLQLDQDHPMLVGPTTFIKAEASKTLLIDAALHSSHASGRIYWRCLDDSKFSPENSMPINLPADGEYHTTTISLSASSAWHGVVVQWRIDPVGHGSPGDWIKIRSIKMGP